MSTPKDPDLARRLRRIRMELRTIMEERGNDHFPGGYIGPVLYNVTARLRRCEEIVDPEAKKKKKRGWQYLGRNRPR